jgi:hypothetical protein
MMATVRHVTSRAGRAKFQAAGFLLSGVYQKCYSNSQIQLLDSILRKTNPITFKRHPFITQGDSGDNVNILGMIESAIMRKIKFVEICV